MFLRHYSTVLKLTNEIRYLNSKFKIQSSKLQLKSENLRNLSQRSNVRKFIYLIPFLYLIFLLGKVDLSLTQDLGRHLMLGKLILEGGSIPATNLFSYTLPDQVFINHHWLPEVIFYLFAKSWGASSVIALKFLLVGGSFGALYYVANRLGGIFWSTFLAFPFLYTLSYRFDTRPEMFSFLYLSLLILCVYLYSQTHKWWYIFALLPLQILWVNSHIYFFVGIIVYGAFVVSEFLQKRRDLRLLGLGCLLVLVSVATPLGIAGATTPLTIFSNYGYDIVENKGILFLNSWFFTPQVFVFELLVVIFVIASALTFSRKYLFWYFISVFGIVAAVAMIRNLSLFAILVYPSFVLVMYLFEKKHIRARTMRATLVTCLFVVVLVQVVRGVASPEFGYRLFEAGGGSLDFIEEKRLSGPIFNNFDVGSYIIYRLYPREKVFVDGRPEAYTPEFFSEYRAIQSDPVKFEAASKKYNFQMIVFSKSDLTEWGRAFLTSMSYQNAWVVVYQDTYYVVLVPKDSENYRKVALE